MVEGRSYSVCTLCYTYNQESYILDALKGFTAQESSTPVVYAIVDDASTDKTPVVLSAFLEENFNTDDSQEAYVEKEGFGSIYFARHRTNVNCFFAVILLRENHYRMKKSKLPYLKRWIDNSKYIAICEGDDYWTDPKKLQKQVDFLEAHDDFVLCCTAFTLTYDGREDDKTIVRFDKDEIRLEDMLQEYWIGTLTTVLKSELFTAFRRPFDDLPMSDLPLWCFLAMTGRIKYLPDVTANYRQLSTSACHFVDPKKQYKFRLDAMRVREYYAQAAGKTAVAAPAFSKHAHFILDECYRNGWLDFPMDRLWHFVEEYGHPSGYDRLKRWGLRSAFRLRLSKKLFDFLKRKVK